MKTFTRQRRSRALATKGSVGILKNDQGEGKKDMPTKTLIPTSEDPNNQEGKDKTDTKSYLNSHMRYSPEEIAIIHVPTHPEYINPSLLLIGPYQRVLHIGRTKSLARNFGLGVVGALEVNRRSDGTLYVVDGQHRKEAAVKANHGQVLCLVREGLDESQESFLFRYLNDQRKPVSKMGGFRADLFRQAPAALDIQRIVTESGYVLDLDEKSKRDTLGKISCIGTLEIIYRGGDHPSKQVSYPERLLEVLTTLHAIWPTQRGGTSATMIDAMDIILHKYKDQGLNKEHLIERLSYADPYALLRVAAARAGVVAKDRPVTLVVYEMIALYNKHLRTKRLVASMDTYEDRRGRNIQTQPSA